ncbi:hypothetical protein MRB53_027081 [Persea americana]|uniref:Uncharacterized protein n=1 Tax=Persea americana TaxID=3435 RepID=A0ACC2LK55_PERAE|nr:hypothetical protein MRB53_027081 [Persea americana]
MDRWLRRNPQLRNFKDNRIRNTENTTNAAEGIPLDLQKCPHPHPVTYPLEEQLLKISYGDLFKSTEGSSSTNLIGVGSYGSIYKGCLDHIGQIVAVKVLNLQRQGASKSSMAKYKALRTVRHRNLLKVLIVCSSIDSKGSDFKALVFDYMANGNLEQWLHLSVDEQHQPEYLSLTQRSAQKQIGIIVHQREARFEISCHCPHLIRHFLN